MFDYRRVPSGKLTLLWKLGAFVYQKLWMFHGYVSLLEGKPHEQSPFNHHTNLIKSPLNHHEITIEIPLSHHVIRELQTSRASARSGIVPPIPAFPPGCHRTSAAWCLGSSINWRKQ